MYNCFQLLGSLSLFHSAIQLFSPFIAETTHPRHGSVVIARFKVPLHGALVMAWVHFKCCICVRNVGSCLHRRHDSPRVAHVAWCPQYFHNYHTSPASKGNVASGLQDTLFVLHYADSRDRLSLLPLPSSLIQTSCAVHRDIEKMRSKSPISLCMPTTTRRSRPCTFSQ